jgi:predicted dehydrogenase
MTDRKPSLSTTTHRTNRRSFLKQSIGAAAGVTTAASLSRAGSASRVEAAPPSPQKPARLRFSVCGINHSHINGMSDAVIRGGGEMIAVFAKEPDLLAEFCKRYPQAKVARSEQEILDDKSTQLVLSSGIPDERAPLGVRVMQHGKDYMVDKPGITTLDQLAEARRVQAATKRIYSICYSERLENRATVKAGELVKSGAIGKVVQTVGLGPHRVNPASRPAWFWDPKRYGGIICDIGSHQFDQFLFFTGSTSGEIVAAQVRNVNHPDHPAFEDFGDAMVRGNQGTGYIRLDWFTPAGLPTWGDGRLTILGTEGFIEIRKNVDIGGREGGNHLFLTDAKSVKYIDCKDVPLPYGQQLVDDVLNRTETAMPQAHCFLAMELALQAQKQARRT